MDHFTLNLRPKEYFQLAPNMRTAYIELYVYLISKSVTYRPGRPQKKVNAIRTRYDFPELARNTYIHLVVGLRAKYYMYLVVAVGLRVRIYIYIYIYIISKSVTYKPGRYKSWRRGSGSPDLARNTYIHLVVGLRAKYYMHVVVCCNILI